VAFPCGQGNETADSRNDQFVDKTKVSQIYILISAPKSRLKRWSFVVWLVGYTFGSSARIWSTEFSRKQEERTKYKVSLSRLTYVFCEKRFMVHVFTEDTSVHFVYTRKYTERDSRQRGNGSVVCIALTRTLQEMLHRFLRSV
jgi:hypothetical protein